MVATVIEITDQKKDLNEVINEINHKFSKIRHGIEKAAMTVYRKIVAGSAEFQSKGHMD